jgi:multiple sugar transport system ATP-binding protein
MSRGISLQHLVKVYADEVRAVDDVSLEIGEGEFVVLVGPSGCGKSTLLRLIAGLEQATEGSVLIGDEDVTHLRPQERDIAMVFQNYALYPHMTVEENLAFGLKLRKTPKAERQQRVLEAARTLGLDELLDRKPAALSGGQRQRVAIGRAMVRNPVAFLMDEPLSNLDAKLRVSMRAALTRLHEQLGVTTVYVTHDQVEAMTLGQRVAVLRDGCLQQVDTPQNLFNTPANLFVAAFIGSPSMNLVEAVVTQGEARFGGHTLALPAELTVPEGRVLVGIRPTDFEHGATADPALPRMRIRAGIVEELGAEAHVIFHIDAPRVATDAVRAAADTHADDESFFADDERAEFTARVDSRSPIAPGSEAELAVHVEDIHFFDRDTGDVLGVGGRRRRTALPPFEPAGDADASA